MSKNKARRAAKFAKHPEWDEQTKIFKGMKVDAKTQLEYAQQGKFTPEQIKDMVGESTGFFTQSILDPKLRPGPDRPELWDDVGKTMGLDMTTYGKYGPKAHDSTFAGDTDRINPMELPD